MIENPFCPNLLEKQVTNIHIYLFCKDCHSLEKILFHFVDDLGYIWTKATSTEQTATTQLSVLVAFNHILFPNSTFVFFPSKFDFHFFL